VLSNFFAVDLTPALPDVWRLGVDFAMQSPLIRPRPVLPSNSGDQSNHGTITLAAASAA
jgi:hypothetical protein